MLDYAKKLDTIRKIPFTYGRYSIDVYGTIYDNLDGTTFIWTNDNLAHPKCPIELGPYNADTPPELLVSLAFKPMAIFADYLPNCTVIKKIDWNKSNNPLDPRKLIWKFITPITYDAYNGYRVMPGFTNYLVNDKGNIISTHTGKCIVPYLSSTGYLVIRLTRDDGREKIMAVHVLTALAWVEYDENVCEMFVDHIDGIKLNNAADNLQWVTPAENNRRARLHDYYKSTSKQLYLKDINTGVKQCFNNITEVANFLGVGKSSIFQHLNKLDANTRFKQRYAIWYCDEGDEIETCAVRRGSQPRPMLVKDLVTGKITRFESISEFLTTVDLSRKQVYGTLAAGVQRTYGNVIFKYEDDPSLWVK